MEIQTNHRLKLLNAKCEYVCAVENLSKKLDYGDDIECCLNKLFLASKLINRLECYCFPTTTNTFNVYSEFNLVYSEFQLFLLNSTEINWGINIYVNGVTHTIISDGVNTNFQLIINKLDELGILVSYGFSNYQIILTLSCNVTDFNFTIYSEEYRPIIYQFNNYVPGVCASTNISTCYNCIEESDLREMYAVLDNLLS